MRKIYITFGTLAFLNVAATWAAQADTQLGDFNLSGNVGLSSQYVFRGITQSDENPALNGGFNVSHASGLYGSIWASSVDFNDGDEASIELDFIAGYAGEYNGFTYDAGVIYYTYPGADRKLDYDFVELQGALGYDFGVAAVKGSINYSPEFFGKSGDAFYYVAKVDVPLPYDIGFAAHVGHQTIDKAKNYTDWSAGFGYNLIGFDTALTYHDTNLKKRDCADGCDAKVVFSVSRSF